MDAGYQQFCTEKSKHLSESVIPEWGRKILDRSERVTDSGQPVLKGIRQGYCMGPSI